ncbi:MAG: ABC transporter ATP-binding protein [Saprospiraceae bacterium]|nr:ABC transporter ATP-binding protein [Saprospiraceae bacterium]
MTILTTSGLTKKYGRIFALKDLDLEIHPGMVFGLLGPNGSGKTTTLGLLLGVRQPTRGSFSWFEQPPSAAIRKKIGAILESPCFHPYMTGFQNLQIAAGIKECPESAIEEVLETVDLYERKDDPFKTYSLGMKQRLAIASSLLSDPEVMILDEPTNGLDPQGIADIRALIIRISETGKTILLASHLLDEVQKVCTHFLILQNGRKRYEGSVEDALSHQPTVEVAARDMQALRSRLQDFGGINKLEQLGDRLILTFEEQVDTEALNRYLHEKGIICTLLAKRRGQLESEFLRILSEDDE